MKTLFIKPKDVERKWWLIDAQDQVLGRLAVRAATLLRGKHKPTFARNIDGGDSVIIINAEKVAVTGRKRQNKVYHHHSGYPGGLKSETFERVIGRKPAFPVEQAIKGMLPRGRLGRKLFLNVKVYAGSQHPHAAQQPEKIEL